MTGTDCTKAEKKAAARWFPALPAIAAFLLLVGIMGKSGPIGRGGYPFIGLYVAASGLAAVIWFYWPFDRRTVPAILLLSVAARALMFPFPVGDDIHRYTWEGMIQNEGYNPYRYAPDSEELAHLRDSYENWEKINHAKIEAIYPPAAQVFFRACAAVLVEDRFFRFAFTLLDLGIILILSALAARCGIEKKHLLLYAINPLILVYFAGEGHLDPLYIFLFMAALLAWKSGREGTAFLLLGAAAAAKLIPIAFFPLLVRRRNIGKAPLFFLPLLLAIPYLLDGSSILAAPLDFMNRFSYNGCLFSVLRLFLPYFTATKLCWATLGAAAVVIFFLVPDTLRSCYLLAGCYLLCSPTVHQWHFSLIVPFLCFFRSFPWLLLLAAVSATFATRIVQYETGQWIDYPLARSLEYIPFAVIVFIGLMRNWRTGFSFFPHEPRSLSVIIPVLNDDREIEESVNEIRKHQHGEMEILVADGGSGDGTAELVGSIPGVTVIRSGPCRGARIRAALDEAQGDVVLIVDPGSRLETGSIERMMESLRQRPDAVGGAFGVAVGPSPAREGITAFIRNAWTRISGISTGSQAQFFRRRAMAGRAADLGMMEDLELSLQMKEAGPVLFLSRGVRQGKGAAQNGAAALVRRVEFIVRRRFGLVAGS